MSNTPAGRVTQYLDNRARLANGGRSQPLLDNPVVHTIFDPMARKTPTSYELNSEDLRQLVNDSVDFKLLKERLETILDSHENLEGVTIEARTPRGSWVDLRDVIAGRVLY